MARLFYPLACLITLRQVFLTSVSSSSDHGLVEVKRWRRTDGIHLFLICLAAIALCLPFVGKAFHIDDPNWVWAAEHIRHFPFDFYGFRLNWFGHEQAMAYATQAPPLFAFYLSLSPVFSEISMHLMALGPVLITVVGVFFLARSFQAEPVTACVVTLLTPAFLVSSTLVMSDMLMTGLWVWAMVFWVWMFDHDVRWGWAAALVAGLCTLAKYNGVSVWLIMGLYAYLKERKWSSKHLFLLIPLGILLGYEIWTEHLYHTGLFSRAAAYTLTGTKRISPDLLDRTWIGLTFLGGSYALAGFLGPTLFPRSWRWPLQFGLWFAAGALVFLALPRHTGPPPIFSNFLLFQTIFWSAVGLQILLLGAQDIRNPSPESWTLAAWMVGTFVFAAYVNWSVTVRALLPAAPVLGLWVGRQWRGPFWSSWPWPARVGLVAGGALALGVALADHSLAKAHKNLALLLTERYVGGTQPLLFEGHWGFQYYAEAGGAKPLDFYRDILQGGQLLAVPSNNALLSSPPPHMAEVIDTLAVPGPRWLTTMHPALGAGFYSSMLGPLPFAFGRIPPESVTLYRIRRSLRTPLNSLEDLKDNMR